MISEGGRPTFDTRIRIDDDHLKAIKEDAMADDQTTGPDPARWAGDRIRAKIYKWPDREGACPHTLSWRYCIYPHCVSASTAGAPGHWRELPPPWVVHGKPVGYSSGVAEQEWKQLIREAVPQAGDAQVTDAGLFADFGIPQPTPQAPGFGLDNLLDPVLSAVINGQGWFGGHRANLRWIAARKLVLDDPAVRLAVLSDPPILWRESDVASDSTRFAQVICQAPDRRMNTPRGLSGTCIPCRQAASGSP